MGTIQAAVRDTETLYTDVSRDHDGAWYDLPAELVEAYERAQAAYAEAQDAICRYIDEHDLQEQED